MPNSSVDDVVKRVHSAMDKVEEMAAPVNRNNTSVRIEAGGVGVWVAVTLCMVMLAVNIGLLAMFINHDRKIDDLNSYLNAIYMMAPHLKPEENKEDTN